MPEDGAISDGLGRAIEAMRTVPTAREAAGLPSAR
jgi:hypothetical protein